jgi:uncharacterized protein YcgI (DUF1989 family)
MSEVAGALQGCTHLSFGQPRTAKLEKQSTKSGHLLNLFLLLHVLVIHSSCGSVTASYPAGLGLGYWCLPADVQLQRLFRDSGPANKPASCYC